MRTGPVVYLWHQIIPGFQKYCYPGSVVEVLALTDSTRFDDSSDCISKLLLDMLVFLVSFLLPKKMHPFV